MTLSKIERKSYIDFLRITAALLVIYNHTAGYHHYLNYGARPIGMFCYIFLSVLTRINVPLFFMISGALLLGKEEAYKTLFSKRVLRFVLVLFVFSFFVYCIDFRDNFQIKEFVSYLFKGSLTAEYWFLYSYLGFLLALPFLRKIAKHLTGRDVLLLLAFQFVIRSLLPTLTYLFNCAGMNFISLSTDFSFPFATTDILFYPLVGYYLDNLPIEKIGKREVTVAFAVLIVGSLVSTAITFHAGYNSPSGFTQSHLSKFNASTVIAFFVIIKYLFSSGNRQIQTRFEKCIAKVGSLTLGVYLLDPLFRDIIYYNPIYYCVDASFLAIPYAIIYCFISLAACGFITYLLKKCRFLEKFCSPYVYEHTIFASLKEDEGFEFSYLCPLVAKTPHLVSLSSLIFP